jgi:hypothetical protein
MGIQLRVTVCVWLNNDSLLWICPSESACLTKTYLCGYWKHFHNAPMYLGLSHT